VKFRWIQIKPGIFRKINYLKEYFKESSRFIQVENRQELISKNLGGQIR
jgi:hypothetical protein